MEMQELTIKRREATGKAVAKRLRRAGEVPAILYGGAKPEPVLVDPKAVLKMIHGREGTTQLLTLKFDGEAGGGRRMAIIRDLQFDPVTEHLLHVDLQEVSGDRTITVRGAVRPVGEPAGGRERKRREGEPRAREEGKKPKKKERGEKEKWGAGPRGPHAVGGRGNPGAESGAPRHNAGQRVLDLLAQMLKRPWHREGQALTAHGQWRGGTGPPPEPPPLMKGCGPPAPRAPPPPRAGPARPPPVYHHTNPPPAARRPRTK